MPGSIQPDAVVGRFRPFPLASVLALALSLSAAVLATCSHGMPPGAVVVDHVPPDACVAFYGPGPCREHGRTVAGSTDAVALWHAEPPGSPLTPATRERGR